MATAEAAVRAEASYHGQEGRLRLSPRCKPVAARARTRLAAGPLPTSPVPKVSRAARPTASNPES